MWRVIFLCLSLSSYCAIADEIDPAKAQAIRELLQVTGAQADQEQLTRTFTQQLISVLQASNTTLPPGSAQIITKEVDLVVAEQLRSEVLQQKMYRIYARYFTLEEIQGLTEFNRSEIGRKANRVMPVLMRESMSAAQEWSEEIGPILSTRVRKKLEEQGVTIGR
jgi:hypothetical protein